jgi:hypothetical protein
MFRRRRLSRFPVETFGFGASLGGRRASAWQRTLCESSSLIRGIFVVFDKSYFQAGLPAHIKASGAEPTVEVHLINGQGHRVRSIVEATEGYVVLEAYQRRAEITGTKGRWQSGKGASPAAPNEIHHAIVSYDSISQVVITPSETIEGSRIGFTAR